MGVEYTSRIDQPSLVETRRDGLLDVALPKVWTRRACIVAK